MLKLYGLLGCMLIVALIMLLIPYRKSEIKNYLLMALFTIVFTSTFYFTLGKPKGLEDWLMQGQNHYRLLVEIDSLGGIDGIIQRIQMKLKNNPDDKQGKMILDKMYRIKKEQGDLDRRAT